jgi:hypothetical protein
MFGCSGQVWPGPLSILQYYRQVKRHTVVMVSLCASIEFSLSGIISSRSRSSLSLKKGFKRSAQKRHKVAASTTRNTADWHSGRVARWTITPPFEFIHTWNRVKAVPTSCGGHFGG